MVSASAARLDSCKLQVTVPRRPTTASHTQIQTELRSYCPVACALDVVGDRWTLLVIRDLFSGKHRFGDFLASPEKIPTNILAERLKGLGIALPPARAPMANYVPARRVGNLVHTAGQVSGIAEHEIKGKLGQELG